MSYLKFLNLVQAIRQLPGVPALDAAEERLLNTFAANWHTGKKISVVEAMNLPGDISASTVHRRLKTLREKGLVALDVDEHDSRIKYIIATPLAHQYFSRMDHCLAQAGE